jgi:hypothetical protein
MLSVWERMNLTLCSVIMAVVVGPSGTVLGRVGNRATPSGSCGLWDPMSVAMPASLRGIENTPCVYRRCPVTGGAKSAA